MIHCDDALGVLEMTIVRRPFVLDFAKATLDGPPDFPQDVWDEFMERKREEFGAARWPKVLAILRALERRYGVFLADLNPGNVGFTGMADGPDDSDR